MVNTKKAIIILQKIRLSLLMNFEDFFLFFILLEKEKYFCKILNYPHFCKIMF